MTMLLLRDLADGKSRQIGRQPSRSRLPPAPPLGDRVARTESWQRRRTRVYLAQLDDRMLKDIGITRVEAAREANKAFWLP